MTFRPSLLLAALLALGLVLLLPARDAWARGGRYGAPGGPAGQRPPAEMEEPEAPPQAAPEPEAPPPPVVETPTASAPTTSDLPRESAGGRQLRGRRTAWNLPGMTNWTWWYEANRERFEDLRRRRLQTTQAPIFHVGTARGPSIGSLSIRIAPDKRSALLDATLQVVKDGDGEWIHTRAAALVALGKLASDDEHVRLLLAVLHPTSDAPAYLKESAALGLGQLKRTERDLRLPPPTLDRARKVLEATLRDDTFQPRTRAFAALSLGLLGDQPSVRGQLVSRATAEILFRTWTDGELPDEVQVGILMGLARVPADAIAPVMRLVLEGCAVRGRSWEEAPSTLVRSMAALTLAEIGDEKSAAALVTLLDKRHKEPTGLKQAAALAAGILGERVPGARSDLGVAVLKALGSTQEPGTRRTLWASLGRLLAAEGESGTTALLLDARAGDRMLEALESESLEERPFVALALGVAVRDKEREDEPFAWHAYRRQGIDALRAALAAPGGDAQNRGAYAVALGLVADGRSIAPLLALLRDKDQTPELRAYAALGLGLIGDGRREVVRAITDAVRDPRDRILQMRAATALGLLGGGTEEDRDASVRILIHELRSSRDQVVKGQIAITLARIGNVDAIAPLIEIAQGAKEPHLNRAMAVAALGLIGDSEVHPVLAASRWNSHYLSHASVVRDILDTL